MPSVVPIKPQRVPPRKLLGKLGLKVSGPHTPARPEPVHHMVNLDGCCELAVQEAGDCLPKYLHHTDPPEVYASLLGN